LFNDWTLIDRYRKYVFLAEGIFDAIALGCVGLLGAKVNPTQINLIKRYPKTVIMLPDRDARGQDMIDVAIQQGWHVAYPWSPQKGDRWWDDDIKDGADAVKRYGRLWSLLSIVETATSNRFEIEAKRRFLPK
jgi:DNA primase